MEISLPPSDLYEQMADASGQPAARDAVLSRAPEVILYGAGGAGRDALRVLRTRGMAVRCFLDRAAQPGEERDSIPVFLPDAAALGPAVRQDVPVVVTIFNPQVDTAEVCATLHGFGWKNVIPFVDFHRVFPGDLGNRYWLTDLSFYRNQAAQMRAGAGVWADARSRAIYDAVLRYRWTGQTDETLSPDHAGAYFPPDIPAWRTPARFVDCGAYDGDTLTQIRARRFPLAAVAAFEPDLAHGPKLRATLGELAGGPDACETLYWPCAVHASTVRLRFAAGLDMASSVHPDGEEIVQAVALDDCLGGFQPTLIKMDIEGAEYDALLGARALIRAHLPGLAICVYHRPEHLWEIPQLIASWNLGYRFWLRPHAYSGYDLVMYAQAPAGTANARPA